MSQPANTPPRRVVRLRVIGGFVDLRNDVPATMADCPTTRSSAGHIVCGHVKCEYHLWLVEGHDRPGRWRERISSELRPVWLEWPLPPACADDLAKRGLSVGEQARALGLGTTQFHSVLATALKKLEAATTPELRELAGKADDDEPGDIPESAPPVLAALKARR